MKFILILLLAVPAYATVINVPAAGTAMENASDLLDAFNITAACGDTIVLQAGGNYSWPFELGLLFRNKECAGNPITIQSDELASLPEGVRVGISDKAHMPKLIATWPGFGDASQPAISIGRNLSGLIFRGIEFKVDDADVPYANILIFMCNDTTSVAFNEIPEYVTFDRVYVHSKEDEVRSGYGTAGSAIFECGNHIEVNNSRLAVPAGMYKYPSTTVNNQYAIFIGNGSYFTAHNNYMISWYASIFTGGYQFPNYQEATLTFADMDSATFSNVAGLNVGDLVAIQQESSPTETGWGAVQITGISGNDVTYTPYGTSLGTGSGSPLTMTPIMPGGARWEGHNPNHLTFTQNTFDIDSDIVDEIFGLTTNASKGWLEEKAGTDQVWNGNEFTGHAAALGFNVRNQGTPIGAWSVWSTLSRMQFTNNRLIGTGGPIRFLVCLEDPDKTSTPGTDWVIQNNLIISDQGAWFDFCGGSDIHVVHNTALTYDSSFTGWSFGVLGFVPSDVIEIRDNIIGEGQGFSCTVSPNTCLNDDIAAMNGNVIIEELSFGSCGGTYPMGNQCVDMESDIGFDGNHALSAMSMFKGDATDMTDPGIDYAALIAALGGSSPSGSGGISRLRLRF